MNPFNTHLLVMDFKNENTITIELFYWLHSLPEIPFPIFLFFALNSIQFLVQNFTPILLI